jgi:hypothetical protein
MYGHAWQSSLNLVVIKQSEYSATLAGNNFGKHLGMACATP